MHVGQKVKYHPPAEDDVVQLLNDNDPCDAVVIAVRGDDADLLVTDHFGRNHIIPVKLTRPVVFDLDAAMNSLPITS